MDDVVGGYREAAPPEPKRFPLRMGAGARISLLIGVGTIALSIVLMLLTGHVFLLFIAALGPGLFYLLSGAPRMIEVRHDAVVIHAWLRAPWRLSITELSVRYDDDVLVIEAGDARMAVAAEHFPAGSFERCLRALREGGADVIDERMR